MAASSPIAALRSGRDPNIRIVAFEPLAAA
jgi:hypothetical protein